MRAEKCLNNFVRFIALLERVGNGIGTLAFIWGTVVVLGGFSTYLANDFWVSTVIVFMEGFRAFSRQSRSDDQFLFKTTRGIKLKRMELGSGILYYMNAAMMTACMWLLTDSIIDAVIILDGFPGFEIFMLLVLLVIIHELGFYTLIGYMSSKESHTLLQLCPGATLLITGLSLYYTKFVGQYDWVDYSFIPLWFSIYILARFGSPGDNCPSHGKVKVAARLLRVACIVAVICGMAHWFQYIPHWFQYIPLLMMFVSSGLGNLQTPMALAPILLSAVWLFLNPIEVVGAPNENIKLAVKFLYIMVMCQGILYLAACMLESLSFLFRRSLALDCDLVDKSGMKSINLYYEQAYDTFLEENLFDTTKKMGLVTFAVDSLNPEASRDKKHAAVRILDSFLQKHKTSSSHTELISRITTSTKAVTTLINMLGWTVTEDADMRLFAAKVIAHISPYLQILGFPGAMQKVSSLLDGHAEPMTQEISAQLLDDFGSNADDQQISDGASSTMNGSRRDIVDRQQTRNGTSNSQLDIEEGRAPGVQGCSLVCKFFLPLMEWKRTFKQHFKDLQSIPHEDSKDKDTLPALGMQILEGLAHDLHNCEEISRAKELLPKIIGFISCMPGKKATQQGEITTSSLILVEKFASVKGEIGMTLQKELSGNLMLISNLTEILEFEGSSSYPEQSRLAMHIIAKIATHKKTRLKIGTIQVIIGKLVQGFIGEDESSKPLRAEAGEALTTLAMECPANCYAMLNKTNCEFIGDLASKLQRDQHIYQAASLLHSLCENCRQLVLSHQGSKDWLLSILTVVLGRIVDAEGKQMKALIGLASQICSIISGGIDPIMESFPNDKELVKKLVGELNAHKKPSPDEFSDMRRWLIELTVSIVESCPRYALIFRQHRMVEALSKVEQYMGLAFSEEAEALPAMVARAKELIGANTP